MCNVIQKIKLSIFALVILFSCSSTKIGFYTEGIEFSKSSFCTLNKCELIKRYDTKENSNFIENYKVETLGNFYEITHFMIKNESQYSITRNNLSFPDSEFEKNVKYFLKEAVSNEISDKFLNSQCKTFDEIATEYNKSGRNATDQGLIVSFNEKKYSITCTISPLTDSIHIDERKNYPLVSVGLAFINK